MQNDMRPGSISDDEAIRLPLQFAATPRPLMSLIQLASGPPAFTIARAGSAGTADFGQYLSCRQRSYEESGSVQARSSSICLTIWSSWRVLGRNEYFRDQITRLPSDLAMKDVAIVGSCDQVKDEAFASFNMRTWRPKSAGIPGLANHDRRQIAVPDLQQLQPGNAENTGHNKVIAMQR